jgi:acyl carrier protein
MDQIEQKVHEVVVRVCRQRSPDLAKVDNSQRLTAELGLSSLDFARVIAILELELGADPFNCGVPVTDVRTVGDLCDAYRTAASGPAETSDAPPAANFETCTSRAAARRSALTGRSSH